MSGQNAATGGANNTSGTTSSNTDAATATAENNSGQTSQTGGTNTGAQTSADDSSAGSDSENVAFTPAQQKFINSLIKAENQKAVDKALKKVNDEKDLSEKERAEKERDEARAEVAERDKRDAFKDSVEGAKIVDVNALYKLIGGELEFENGKFKNLTKVLEGAKTTYAFLFPKVETTADAGKKDETTVGETKPGVDRMRAAYEQTEKS